MRVLATAALVLSMLPSAFAIRIYVPGDYGTIQSAIDAASAAGDSILVDSGSYPERVNFKGKAVVVRAPAGPDSTTIDGRGIDPCVVMWSAEGPGSVLDGFTLSAGANDNGGGVHLNGASPTLKNLRIVGCTAAAAGGGVYALNDAQPLLLDCHFQLCSAGDYGAALASYRSSPWLERCLVSANSAATAGGGIWASRGAPTVISCTFDQNSADVGAHAAFLDSSDVVFRNSIAVQSSSSGIWADGSATVYASYNDVWGNTPDYVDVTPGAGSLSVDPLFVPGTYQLQEQSPCIDVGDPDDPPPAGGGARIDIGAHEYDYGTRVIDVSPGQSIQAAIDSAQGGDLIRVQPGTYHENLDLMGQVVELSSSGGPELTVIDGGDSSSVIWIHRGESASTRISGFTLRRGSNTRGAGLLIEGADPTVRDLIIEDCSSSSDGGGIYVRNWCSPALSDIVVRNNYSGRYGGGLGVYLAAPIVQRLLFHDNTAAYQGGAVFWRDSDGELRDCTIAYNEGGNGPGGSGGIYVDQGGAPSISGNIISHSTKGSGVRVLVPAAPMLSYNCSWGHNGNDYDGIDPGPGSISADPLFVSAASWDFHLSSPAGHFEGEELRGKTGALSPCIDAGDPLLDPAPEPIPNGGRRNLGAYAGTLAAARTPGARFEVPADYASIGAALAEAAHGDTIHLGDFATHEHVVINGLMVSLIGDGTGVSIIDGDHSRRCLTMSGINAGTVEISGITFREGNGEGVEGGAILLDDASPAIHDCEIMDSSAPLGGAILVSRGDPQLTRLEIHDNFATESGGAIAFVEEAAGELLRSVLWTHHADSLGGAIYAADSAPTILNCTIDDQYSGLLNAGGGIHVGGGAAATVRNCSISSTSNGIGVYGAPGSLAIVTHSNGYANAPGGDWGGLLFGDSNTRLSRDPKYTYSDPFYGLQPGSNLIDRGDPGDPVPEGGGDRVDIGAYEFVQRIGEVVEVPDDYPTIAEGLAAVGEGDTVLVHPGTYAERLVMVGVGINLVGDAGEGEVVITPSDPGQVGDPLLWIQGVNDPSISVSGLVFEGGNSSRGGGLLLDYAEIRIEACEFRYNLATQGGGVAVLGGAPTIENCRFLDNIANDGGGGGLYVVDGSDLELRGCLLAGNQSNRDGGGIYVAGGQPEFVNVTVAHNHAAARGAGLFLTGDCYPAIRNTIVAANEGAEGIYAAPGSAAELRRNDVWGHEPHDYAGLAPGGGDMSEDPLFVGGTPFDYHLQSTNGSWHDDAQEFVADSTSSPCIDRGINPYNDPLVEPVPNGGLINLGFAGNTPQASMSSSQVLDVPSAEFPTIQDAVASALDGDQVLVAPGTFTGPFNFEGKDIVLVARGGPDSTALRGIIGQPVLTIGNAESAAATVDGFRFEGHTADMGAAILINGASPTIINCHFIDNMATLDGGGALAVLRGAARIMNNTFIDNQAVLEGGALMATDAALYLKGNHFRDNISDHAGGAVAIVRDGLDPLGSASVFENEFLLNEATGSGGGGLYVQSATPSIRLNRFDANTTPFHGGGLYATGDDVGGTLYANLFVGNEASDLANDSRGGGCALRYSDGGELLIANNTLVGNLAAEGSGIMVQSAEAVVANNILVQGRSGAAFEVKSALPVLIYNNFWNNEAESVAGMIPDPSNLELNPEFADTSFALSPHSPMIDAGYPGSALDADGSVADLGALPFTHTLELTVVPDSTWIQAGEVFGMQVDVFNPDLQIQGPIVRETLVSLPDDGPSFVANLDTLYIDAQGLDAARVEGPVHSRAPAGFYGVQVSISVGGVVYDQHDFELEIMQ